ncbi:SIMPL domain-containing protein [Agromyces marinus]|uniref:SIMPL domain-containing protein n=1 Tax=Agromyces marinus TaxID=1389020 RepID=A0ABM8H5D5_9MICO|nr:SIMPL domain-containing protein [Agromyces marinus]UIP59000.1 hypothetical protein DSM26151_18930 [Agromyces marinus]BDZ56027.1 SIMPL domain-containing protein [Agromyces marinus]
MSTTISVTGRADEHVEPELGVLRLTVAASGQDREHVLAQVGSAHEQVLSDLRGLDAAGSLESWSAGSLRVWSHRPWNAEGRRLPLVHEAAAEVEASFRDLDALGAWAGPAAWAESVTLEGIEWRLTEATRSRVHESAQRRAVADAVRKAGVYAEALGLAAPVPVEIADHGMPGERPVQRNHRQAPVRAMAMADAAAPAAEFAPAKLVVEAAVDARFSTQ